jgi:hypothetical protein
MDAHGHVYREWSRRMAEMGIFPVYPPREDIVVGDVYALPLHPYDTAAVGYLGGLGNAGIHVEYLGDTNLFWTNFLTRLERYYQTRPYPADSTNTLVSGTNIPLTRIVSYPDETQRSNAFSPGSLARLRQVSFPDFTITHIDQKSLSAVVPIEGIMASFNFNHSDIQAVHMSIPHAESYGLTTQEALREIYDDNYLRQTANGIYLNCNATNGVISVAGAMMAYGMFRDIVTQIQNNPDNCIPGKIRRHMAKSVTNMKNKIYLALITEVYFARSIDITIDRKKATGASASARPIASSELQQLKDMGLLATHTKTNSVTTNSTTVAGGSTNVFTGTKAEVIEITEGDTAYDLARKLRGMEVKDSVENIGGSVRVLSVSTGNIGLRRTFERPICVGVRGVILKLEINDPVAFDEEGNISRKGKKEWLKVAAVL